MKYIAIALVLVAAVSAQVTVVVDPTMNVLDAIPEIASIGELSPASTSSRIVVNVQGSCANAEQELKGVGYNAVECS